MWRNAVIAIALTLLPVAASAQEHKHGESTSKAHAGHNAAAKHAEHANFAQLLVQKREELKLSEEQVTKLEDLSAKMQQHHAQMSKAGMAKATEEDHTKMHEALMSIFTEEQAVKVQALMKQHKEKCAEDKQCKMDSMKKKEL